MTRHLGHVTLSGDRAGTYIIEEERPGRRLVIAPVTCSSASADGGARDATREEFGARDATREEFAAFEAEYGPFLPPDGEG
jgi:hypothetical protein